MRHKIPTRQIFFLPLLFSSYRPFSINYLNIYTDRIFKLRVRLRIEFLYAFTLLMIKCLSSTISSRLFPLFLSLMLFCTYILPDINNGPQWNLVVEEHSRVCEKNMWKSFLFIHNYFGFEDMV